MIVSRSSTVSLYSVSLPTISALFDGSILSALPWQAKWAIVQDLSALRTSPLVGLERCLMEAAGPEYFAIAATSSATLRGVCSPGVEGIDTIRISGLCSRIEKGGLF